MDEKQVSINVVVDAKIFYQFSVFDALFRTNSLINMTVFAAVMGLFSLLCFFVFEDAAGLGVLLIIIGISFPAAYTIKTLRRIKMQISFLDLENPKTVYSLYFAENIKVTNHGGGEEPLYYEWNSIFAVYRKKGCIYLYVQPEKAYLLPDGQATPGTEALWEIIVKNTGQE